MTEAEWLACDDPAAMLTTLLRVWRKPSSRKLRLFACACFRHVPKLFETERGAETVEVVERFADGDAGKAELSRTFSRVWSVPVSHWAALTHLTPSHVELLRSEAASYSPDGLAERSYQTQLLRDIFGPRGRVPPSLVAPAWRTSTVVALARGMYESRDFSAMPILADALQDAGCDNDDILSHCRGPGPHVRGCWVIDLVLGKE